jgi:hypothetical protein
MTNPEGPNTVILTYSIAAGELLGLSQGTPAPLFVSENNPQRDSHGRLAAMSRKVSTVSVEFGSSLGGREQVSVEFVDGTPPARLFDPDDMVDVHIIWPGRDLAEAFGQ